MRHSLFLFVVALCVCSLPAAAGTVLFSDLGTGFDVYATGPGFNVAGSEGGTASSATEANLFTVSGSGSEAVSQIDLGASSFYLGALGTFYAAIWTDSGGVPGSQVAGAYWSQTTYTVFGNCCNLVSIAGISGVTLTGGQQYFMILGPVSLSDSSMVAWNENSQGVTGLAIYSTDGGGTWTNGGVEPIPIGAFDVIGTPEPGTMLLLSSGLLALGFLRKRLHR
jgi:hypothetical protein